MKYCTKCGAQCTDTMQFCTECGAPLTQSTDTQNAQNTQNNPYNAPNSGQAGPYTYGDSNTQAPGYTPTPAPGANDNYTYNTSSNMNYNNANYNNTNYNNAYGNNVNYGGPYPGITPRSIPLCVILSIVTCGIYAIYWMIKLNDEINQLSGEPNATSGGMVFLFSLITCGIYGFYWVYKMGERCDRINRTSGNSNILYLVISLVGFSIIAYCLMQDTINKTV